MKNTKIRFKINSFTYFLILSALWTGLIKNISLILLIVIIHELGHVFWLKHYEYEVEEIEIFPFGGITKVNKPVNTPIKHEITIAMGGVIAQILLGLIFFCLIKNGKIYQTTYELFSYYNKTLIFFNLLPIIPLDGSILMHSIWEYFFPYKKAISFYFVSSVLAFFGFVTFHTLKSLNNYMIITFLFFKIYESLKNRKYILNRFYLERYLYEFPYEKIESHNYPDLSKLKKDTLHFFWQKDRYLHEKEFLKHYYLPNNQENDRLTLGERKT